MITTRILKQVSFKKDFEETLLSFEKIIVKDSNIQNRIQERYKKHGSFSPAIEFLIERYVGSKTGIRKVEKVDDAKTENKDIEKIHS